MPRRRDNRERVLRFIQERLEGGGHPPPTMREIASACRLAPGAVQRHLEGLVEEGLIRRSRGARGILLAPRGGGASRSVRVPLLGAIAAGQPLPDVSAEAWRDETLETLELTEEITRGKEVYALRVRGLSMIDALIDDGDVVLVEPVPRVGWGEVAVVWLRREQEATLKRVEAGPGRVVLRPANPAMAPLEMEPDNVAVQGRVVAVVRLP